jgi:hypothetical protein
MYKLELSSLLAEERGAGRYRYRLGLANGKSLTRGIVRVR